MFTKAIVKKPCRNMVKGISSAALGTPDYEKALAQHASYVETLKKCGLQVSMMEATEEFPDSVFVEDTAVVTSKCAVLANPGAVSRNQEIVTMRTELIKHFPALESIKHPGTLDGGDVMMVENHFYVGLSARTNRNGAEQLIAALSKHGFSGSVVEVADILHLKTGINYLSRNIMLGIAAMKKLPEFKAFRIIEIDPDEAYAANSLFINDIVIVPAGFPKTRKKIEAEGFKVLETDTSEFRKLDGGLSCLSLRF